VTGCQKLQNNQNSHLKPHTFDTETSETKFVCCQLMRELEMAIVALVHSACWC